MPFPTTAVLDAFDRADGAAGASWSIFNFAVGGISILSNQARVASAFGGSYWNAGFGADHEVFFDVPTFAGSIDLYLRVAHPENQSLTTGYVLHVGGAGSSWEFFRVDPVFQWTSLGSAAGAFASGDTLGASIVGTQLTAYRKPAAGSWAQVLTGTDARYAGAGVGGLALSSTSARIDNFGGGTLATALPFAPNGGFPRLADGRLAMTATATGAAWRGGQVLAPTGELVVTTAAPVRTALGFRRDANDALAVAVDAAGTWSGGFVRDGNGALCVTSTGPFTWQAGFLRDAAGRLAVQLA